MRQALSFDDVLIIPKYNSIKSRREVDVRTDLGVLRLDGPILAANMPTVCESDMAEAMEGYGAGIIHRMCPPDEQVRMVYESRNQLGFAPDVPLGAAVGIGENAHIHAADLKKAGANILCIDVAHGHQKRVKEVAVKIIETVLDASTTLIIGNIATAEAAADLLEDVPLHYTSNIALKVGVGGGSMCTTRIATGCGVPTFQSVLDVARYRHNSARCFSIIADGGIKSGGDIAKSIAAGADAVMIGSLLAGTIETPGEVLTKDGISVKAYRGAASASEKEKYFGEAEYVEGAETYVPLKQSARDVCQGLIEGLQSAMTYTGQKTIKSFQKNSEFVRMTSAGFKESMPHGLF